jgi:hypothetical protein
MPAMASKSRMRKYRKRRQQAGLILLLSLAIIVLGVTSLFRTDPSQRTSGTPLVDRVEVPMVSEAPEAVSEPATLT